MFDKNNTEGADGNVKIRCTTVHHQKLERRNYCSFCFKLVTNFSRHLQLCHPDEEQVKEYIQILDEDLQVRKTKSTRFTNELKNTGNRLHNMKIMQNNFETELLPFKRNNNGKGSANIATHTVYIVLVYLKKKACTTISMSALSTKELPTATHPRLIVDHFQ